MESWTRLRGLWGVLGLSWEMAQRETDVALETIPGLSARLMRGTDDGLTRLYEVNLHNPCGEGRQEDDQPLVPTRPISGILGIILPFPVDLVGRVGCGRCANGRGLAGQWESDRVLRRLGHFRIFNDIVSTGDGGRLDARVV